MSLGSIPRNRLKWIPPHLRAAHSYCFFLHDEAVRALVEYEKARANLVTINFESTISAEEFAKQANEDPAEALRNTGYPEEARRVVINAITMAMVSDAMHHVYEALICFEKRKIVVAFNLLRKPLKQNLLYLAWMLGDEDAFYNEFMSGNPENISQKKVGNFREEIFAKAKAKMPSHAPFSADIIEKLIYDRKYEYGFEKFFEHAVHLVTIERIELKTTPQNFNFIFKNYADDDVYELLYAWLPYLLYFLSQTIIELYDRMRPMDPGTKAAFDARSLLGFTFVQGGEGEELGFPLLGGMLAEHDCEYCKAPIRFTRHNAAKIVLTDSFRCHKCKRKNLIPFSWYFGPIMEAER